MEDWIKSVEGLLSKDITEDSLLAELTAANETLSENPHYMNHERSVGLFGGLITKLCEGSLMGMLRSQALGLGMPLFQSKEATGMEVFMFPLLEYEGNTVDSREELLKKVKERGVLGLTGRVGVGKTALMRHIAYGWAVKEVKERCVVLLDMQGVAMEDDESVGSLLQKHLKVGEEEVPMEVRERERKREDVKDDR